MKSENIFNLNCIIINVFLYTASQLKVDWKKGAKTFCLIYFAIVSMIVLICEK